jgi:hypothetical protein
MITKHDLYLQVTANQHVTVPHAVGTHFDGGMVDGNQAGTTRHHFRKQPEKA